MSKYIVIETCNPVHIYEHRGDFLYGRYLENNNYWRPGKWFALTGVSNDQYIPSITHAHNKGLIEAHREGKTILLQTEFGNFDKILFPAWRLNNVYKLKEEKELKFGDCFKDPIDNEVYIFSQVNGFIGWAEVCLISLINGNRYKNPIRIDNIHINLSENYDKLIPKRFIKVNININFN